MIAPSRRLAASCALLLAALLLLCVWSLCGGAVPLKPGQVVQALTGNAPRSVTLIVTEWRLPRAAMALLVGASAARFFSR